jgi:hypothetical protein
MNRRYKKHTVGRRGPFESAPKAACGDSKAALVEQAKRRSFAGNAACIRLLSRGGWRIFLYALGGI